jgi:hypothetical protein
MSVEIVAFVVNLFLGNCFAEVFACLSVASIYEFNIATDDQAPPEKK